MRKMEIIATIEGALEYSRFTNASFGRSEEKTVEVKELTKLYRETWIIPKLERALELLKK